MIFHNKVTIILYTPYIHSNSLSHIQRDNSNSLLPVPHQFVTKLLCGADADFELDCHSPEDAGWYYYEYINNIEIQKRDMATDLSVLHHHRHKYNRYNLQQQLISNLSNDCFKHTITSTVLFNNLLLMLEMSETQLFLLVW